MAHDAAKLRDLLERCEAARGPDRGIDVAIARCFGTLGHAAGMSDEGLVGPFSSARCYTASLDASIALVERMLPGWGRSVYWNNCQGYLCAVEDNENTYKGSTNQTFEAIGETAALALLAAMLKGLISQAEGEAQHG